MNWIKIKINKTNFKEFYKNQINDSYKFDERILVEILVNSPNCVGNNEKLNLVFGNKNRK